MSDSMKGKSRVPATTTGGDPLRRRSATTSGRRLRRFGLVLGIVGVTSLAAAYAGSSLIDRDAPATPEKSAAAPATDPKLAALEAERERAADAAARREAKRLDDDARKAVVERELAELERQRDALKREVAELAAPLSSPEQPAARPEGPTQPDEAQADVAEAPADEAGEAPAARAARTDQGPIVARASTERDQPERSAATVDDPLTAEPEGSVRVFIHVRASDARAIARARAVAAELEREGVAVAGIRGVPFPVRQDAMRYFYDADRGSLDALSRAVEGAVGVAPRAQDFRRYGAPPRRGTLELWLS
ncbi:hypothetical protein JOD31_003844 [Methylopila capsulata]|uniref:Uncharacterized protein n=1 Tax=Methylopila capsulata TaxID=61654 RepID=A0A9W6IX20_9HYPH|nr:hypothetical protein [Methylopila capsulata]MBM7853583.1 hypothetical protein [Methylopila capsulata]GLK57202.1 hypothetical protein GCM10008170_32220 [Methylopila capsulata]